MDELVARSSSGHRAVRPLRRIKLRLRRPCADLQAIEALDVAKATDEMLHHINHIEADLDLRVREEIALKDALMLPGLLVDLFKALRHNGHDDHSHDEPLGN